MKDTGSLAELSHQILVGLARSGLTSAMAQQANPNPGISLAKTLLSVANDLPSYLKTLHRRLTTREVAQLLNCHPETIYKRIRFEKFPAYHDGGRLKFEPGEIAAWLERRSPTARNGKASAEHINGH